MSEIERPDEVTAAPDEEKKSGELETITNHEAMERLRKGLPLENVKVTRLAFRETFTEPVRLVNVVLNQPRFDGATFEEEVNFKGCTIDRPHFGKQTIFSKGWNLATSTVIRAQMLRVTVVGSLDMSNVHFRGKFVMNRCVVDRIRVWDARFHNWVEFKHCEFREDGDFRSFQADEGFLLNQCKCLCGMRFRGSSINKKLDFTTSEFESMIDLSRTKIHDYAYLENIKQGEKQKFALANIVGDRLLIEPAQIEDRLASEEAGDYTDAMHEYAFLKRVYQTLHQYDREDWAFYRFKVNQRRCCERTWWRPWTKVGQFCDWLVLDQGCGYCTNPFRAIRTALILILIFAAIYASNINQLREGYTLPFPEKPITSMANRVTIGLFLSVATFTSGVGSIEDMAKGWMNVPLMIESLVGILLWGLFIVAFSRKVIR